MKEPDATHSYATRGVDAAVSGPRPHVPVLLAEVLAVLAPADGRIVVDATFGAGGYSSAILEAARCEVIALDRDPEAVAAAAPLVATHAGRLTVVNATFGLLDTIVPAADAVVLDIGVSSMQLDRGERGFSFQTDGPLDMRMSQSGPLAGASAADVVNTLDADEIADILWRYGEERRSRHIARAIVEARAQAPFARTGELARLVAHVLGTPKIDGRHAATRTFQALRIHVNDELGELERGLAAAERVLRPGGRLAVVTFHSLEDRIVKEFLRARSGRLPRGSRHAPPGSEAARPLTFELEVARAIVPDEAEGTANPRARSARLRWARRTDAPAWS